MAVGVAPIPEGASRMIVSVIYHPHHPALPDGQLTIVTFAGYLHRAVVIFTPRTEGLPPALASALSRPSVRMGLLSGVIDAISLRNPEVKSTLVRIDQDRISVPEPTLERHYKGTPASNLRRHRGRLGPVETQPAAMRGTCV